MNGQWFATSPYGPNNSTGGVNLAPYGPWNGMPASGSSPVIGTPANSTPGQTAPYAPPQQQPTQGQGYNSLPNYGQNPMMGFQNQFQNQAGAIPGVGDTSGQRGIGTIGGNTGNTLQGSSPYVPLSQYYSPQQSLSPAGPAGGTGQYSVPNFGNQNGFQYYGQQ